MGPSPAAVSAIAAVLVLSLFPSTTLSFRPWHPSSDDLLYGTSKHSKPSPVPTKINLKYHEGPILTSNITLKMIWYGEWNASEKRIIRDFVSSISNTTVASPSVHEWWNSVRLYTDSFGRNVTGSVRIGGEKNDRSHTKGGVLTRAGVELVIRDAIRARTKPLAFTPGTVYVVLTSANVSVERFCMSSCGHHDVTKKKVVGVEAPYVWLGNSRTQCPGMCSFPYAVPSYVKEVKPVGSPNGDGAMDGMVIVLAHELAETATDPFTTGWFYGQEVDPQEVGDLCEGIYGTGGGGAYPGQMTSQNGVTYNVLGSGRRFTLPWLWNRYRKQCFGPNAVDG